MFVLPAAAPAGFKGGGRAACVAQSPSCRAAPPENELMWTHYAGNYSGICIEY